MTADVYLPMLVLEEIDAGKKGLTEAARNARQFSRFVDDAEVEVIGVGAGHSCELVGAVGEGFIEPAPENGGIFAAGSASDALDVNRAVQSATAASLRAIQVVGRVSRAEA